MFWHASVHPSICLSTGGGVPISHNALQHFPECHEAAGGTRTPPWGGTRVRYPPGGYPVRYPLGGYPGQVPPGGGTRSGTPGGYPGQVPPVPGQVPPGGTRSGTPLGGTQVRYPGGVPGPPRGGYPGRTTEGVLTTRRAVCLLRSRRRTFLFSTVSGNCACLT